MVYNGLSGMYISENYVGIFVSTRLLGYNMAIFQIYPEFNAILSKGVYDLSIYSVYNEVI